jgi:D-cysteine desulfhydrase
VSDSEPALFRAFPSLRQRCPRRAFTALPTPIEPFPLAGVPEGGLWVKRDDRSCAAYGGNKPRKLEFVIGAALARGARRLVTSGGLGTNHGLATAILGRAAGLATTLVLIPQPVTDAVRSALLLHAAYGADLVYGATIPTAALRGGAALAAAALRGERPFVIPTGGSSHAGQLGFVSAGFELAEQVRGGGFAEPAEVWVPVGSGGTLAGLSAGLRLAGLSSRVVGVLVTDILPPSPRGLARAANATLRHLRALGADTRGIAVSPADFDLVRDQLGSGYGAATPAGREAVADAARCGLELETTYTGKTLAALRARHGRWPAHPVLFWNTYNSVDAAAGAPCPPDPEQLPARLRRLLDAPRAAQGSRRPQRAK